MEYRFEIRYDTHVLTTACPVQWFDDSKPGAKEKAHSLAYHTARVLAETKALRLSRSSPSVITVIDKNKESIHLQIR